MAYLFFAVIMLVVGLSFLKMKKNVNPESGKTAFSLVGVIAIIICVASLIGSFVRVVPTGHTGVVTTFGKVENVTYEAGINIVAPWKKVINMDNRIQYNSIALSCFSSDIQEVTLVYTVNYQIDKANAQTIYKTIGEDYYGKVVEPKVIEAVKGVFSKYNAEDLVAARGTLSKEVESVLTESVKQYNVEIVSTSIEDIDFTDAFTNAVEAKQVAEQNKLKAKTESEQAIIEANAEAEKVKIAAQAEADKSIISANADAEVAKIGADAAEYQGLKDAAIMSNLGAMLSQYPELIEYYYVTGWDGELPDTMLGDNSNTLLDITR